MARFGWWFVQVVVSPTPLTKDASWLNQSLRAYGSYEVVSLHHGHGGEGYTAYLPQTLAAVSSRRRFAGHGRSGGFHASGSDTHGIRLRRGVAEREDARRRIGGTALLSQSGAKTSHKIAGGGKSSSLLRQHMIAAPRWRDMN